MVEISNNTGSLAVCRDTFVINSFLVRSITFYRGVRASSRDQYPRLHSPQEIHCSISTHTRGRESSIDRYLVL